MFPAFPILLEHFLELQLSNDSDLFADDSLVLCLLNLFCLCGALDDPEGADVAASDLSAIIVLMVAMLLVDSHRSRVHGERAIQGGLPGCLEVVGKTSDIMDHGVQIANLTRPSVHLTVGLGPRVPGRLRFLTVTMVEAILLDGEAMRHTFSWHVYHPALDLEWGNRT